MSVFLWQFNRSTLADKTSPVSNGSCKDNERSGTFKDCRHAKLENNKRLIVGCSSDTICGTHTTFVDSIVGFYAASQLVRSCL